MRMHHDMPDAKPCRHMEGLLNRFADKRGGRLLHWFVRSHVKGCGGCRRYLDDLMENKMRLRHTKLPPDAKSMARLAMAVQRASETIGEAKGQC